MNAIVTRHHAELRHNRDSVASVPRCFPRFFQLPRKNFTNNSCGRTGLAAMSSHNRGRALRYPLLTSSLCTKSCSTSYFCWLPRPWPLAELRRTNPRMERIPRGPTKRGPCERSGLFVHPLRMPTITPIPIPRRWTPPGSTRIGRAGVSLLLPEETEAFSFVVFGDRTGGPPEGIEVLKQAVQDVNLLEPDLVMTVGDLIEGYNNTDAWLPQMREYQSVMGKLLCPWFPVAGNHDIYWRGEDRPAKQHEANYELHFGPLWYAFRHKACYFIALFSDEGNPADHSKSFEDPAAQRMSPEQFSWLEQTLRHAADAQHVFLFLHHPRWLGGGYGDDWERVHRLLARRRAMCASCSQVISIACVTMGRATASNM